MDKKILIIGATGFIGSNLLNYFEKENIPVRVMARTTSKVVSTSNDTEVVYGDLDKVETLKSALEGIGTIYYLAHAMNDTQPNFVERELNQSKNISSLLSEKQRLIYLGGIIPEEKLSEHLRARESTGAILRESKAEIIEFRASIVVGDGSASFEIVRNIINKLPLIISADWSKSKCQPIALSDVLSYLVEASKIELSEKEKIYNIGGQDVIVYDELLSEYARFKGLYRPKIHIPLFPKEGALKVLELISSEYFTVGERLLESIEHETIVRDTDALNDFNIKPKSLKQAFLNLNDDTISNASMSKFFETNLAKELPQYLVGEGIQIFIPLINKNFEKYIHEKLPIVSQFIGNAEEVISDGNLDFRVPKVGHFRISYNKAKAGALVIVKPEFFFQSLGFTFLKKLLA